MSNKWHVTDVGSHGLRSSVVLALLAWLAAFAIGCAGEQPARSAAPTPEEARSWVQKSLPPEHTIDLDTVATFGLRTLPLLVVSVPTADIVHPYTPYDTDWETKIFYFNAVPPTEIVGHQLLKASTESDDIWEEIGCQNVLLARLSDSASGPVVLAQRCDEEGLLTWRFVVFDSATVSTPGVGTASWAMATDPSHVHEQLVPILDSAIASEPSTRRGDGRTVVEGVEGEIDSTGQSLRTRNYYIVWRDGRLERETGEWITTGD